MMSRLFITHCSRNYASWSTVQKKPSSLMKTIVNDYDNYVPKIIDQGLAKCTIVETAQMRDRIKKSSEYYTCGRKPVQGEFMTFAYEAIEKPEVISDELLKNIKILVATVEMVQSYFFFWDDLEDNSKIRCDKPCWHLISDTGSLAMNDACIMRSFIDDIIRQNFKGELRDNILDIYSKVYFSGSMGQYYDTAVARSKNFDNFTMEQYNLTNKLKSSFYSIKSPVLLALALSKKLNKESYNVVDDVCNDIGSLVQIHNDLIDFFNTEGSVTGKSGTDIQEGKCSWAAVAILSKCNPEQRKIFKENYGHWDPNKVNRIRKLYKELNLIQLYREEESVRYDLFHKKVRELPKNATPSAEFFLSFSDLISGYSEDITALMYDKY